MKNIRTAVPADSSRKSQGARIAKALALSAVRLVTSKHARSLPVGAAKIGGWPDLPPGLAWPENAGQPVPFVLQVNLDELVKAVGRKRWPRIQWTSGMYWVFAPEPRGPWMPTVEQSYHVLSARGSTKGLVRRKHPGIEFPFFQCSVRPEIIATYPHPTDIDLCRKMPKSSPDYEAYDTWWMSPLRKTPETWHQIGGYGNIVQYDPRKADDVRNRLFIQVGNDDKADIFFGDGGQLLIYGSSPGPAFDPAGSLVSLELG